MKWCFCHESNDCDFYCVDGLGKRSKQHQMSGVNGLSQNSICKDVQNLLDTKEVYEVTIHYDVNNNCYDLKFKTLPTTCASKLCYYLFFLES